MATSPVEVTDLLNDITTDVRSIISNEIALVKAEIRPAVRHAGVGAGLFGAAGYFAVSATIIMWFTIATGFSWLYAAVTPLSPWGCVFLGTLTAVFILLIIAVVFILAGKNSFSKIEGPHRAPDNVAETLTTVFTAVGEGKKQVEAELRGA